MSTLAPGAWLLIPILVTLLMLFFFVRYVLDARRLTKQGRVFGNPTWWQFIRKDVIDFAVAFAVVWGYAIAVRWL